MKKELIKASLLSGELKLSFWQKFTHFGIVFYFLTIPILFLFLYLKDYILYGHVHIKEGVVYMGFGSLFLSGLFYYLQKRKLMFKITETQLELNVLRNIILETGKSNGWTTKTNNKSVVVFKTHPGFLSGSWGEQVTVLFSRRKVMINSICDLDKKSSVVSYGGNKRNVKRLVTAITLANTCENN